MGCSGCSPLGCGDKGHCSTGSCNKMNTYDWINTLDLDDPSEYQFVEVSFKNGARKDFYYNDPNSHCTTGDLVTVEAQAGYDVGTITLSGELVRLQMKKKKSNEDRVLYRVIRRANERDLEKLDEARKLENASLVRGRAIAQTLDLDMKLGDIEYQGDMKKATFFYTANGRIDFRELVRVYAKEFKVKIEMRQIGSRQESSRIGGIGSCGRELCCSTWLSDFRSVNTSAARYQNIAINQTKLSGQCGRLKCCLNYELDTYMDALKSFPVRADYLMTKKGRAVLMKTDIFKGLMFYAYEDIAMRGVFHPLDKERVKEILEMNKKGVHPDDLTSFVEIKPIDKDAPLGYEDVTGEIVLPDTAKKKKSKNRQGQGRREGEGRHNSDQQNQAPRPQRSNPSGGENPNNPAGPKPPQRDNRPQQRDNRPPQQDNRPQQRDNRNPEKRQNPPQQNQNKNVAGPNQDRQNPPRPENTNLENTPTKPEGQGNENRPEGSKKSFHKRRFNKNKNKPNNTNPPPAGA